MPETEKKYDYNGITTEKERYLICSATSDIKNYADTASLMLEDIISVHFSQSSQALKSNTAKAEYFLANYNVMSAKLYAVSDYIDRICTVLDFLHGENTHRTAYLSDTIKNLMNFLTT